MAHQSIFTYNLVRPYPFKWFTWTVVIGGLAALALVTVLNYATNAYLLVSVYTTDPNGTIAERYWFDRPPFNLVQKLHTACQPQSLPVQQELFTTNEGLVYKLMNVTSRSPAGDVEIQPSLTYLNNTLVNCTVPRVMFEGVNSNSIGNSPYWVWERSMISAIAQCQILNGPTPTNITLYTEWRPSIFIWNDQIPDKYGNLIRRDLRKAANLWWGQEILYPAWFNLLIAIGNIPSAEDTPHYTCSRVKFDLAPVDGADISSRQFFYIKPTWIQADGQLYGPKTVNTNITDPAGVPLGPNLDALIKAFYSIILTDLGSVGRPNILADTNLLQSTLNGLHSAYKDANIYSGDSTSLAWSIYGPATKSLSVTPATFYTRYLCQEPVLKSVGTRIVVLLVADLVLLRALWSLFILVTSFGLRQADPMAYHCEGCRKGQNMMPLGDVSYQGLLAESMTPSIGEPSPDIGRRGPAAYKRVRTTSSVQLVDPYNTPTNYERI